MLMMVFANYILIFILKNSYNFSIINKISFSFIPYHNGNLSNFSLSIEVNLSTPLKIVFLHPNGDVCNGT